MRNIPVHRRFYLCNNATVIVLGDIFKEESATCIVSDHESMSCDDAEEVCMCKVFPKHQGRKKGSSTEYAHVLVVRKTRYSRAIAAFVFFLLI